MEKQPLFYSKKEWLLFLILMCVIFSISLSNYYYKYSEFNSKKYHKIDGIVINQYTKIDKKNRTYTVLKIKNSDYTFYTTTFDDIIDLKKRGVNLTIYSEKITFYQFLTTFYVRSFDIFLSLKEELLRDKILRNIDKQHDNDFVKNIYKALFLGENLDKKYREVVNSFGVAHLFALSGFHLGIISFISFAIFKLFYSYFHNNFFPYRNFMLDYYFYLVFILCFYLFLTGFLPSLIRSFAMIVFGIFMILRNIKIITFENLFLVILFLIAIFPKLIFSLSFFLSISGVFYIFLFLKYIKIRAIFELFFISIYLFISMSVIVHYFFPLITLFQLLSPIISILFTIFYPFVIFLHIVGYGDFFDSFLIEILNLEIEQKYFTTPTWLFYIYIFLSLLSILKKEAFYMQLFISGFFVCFLYFIN